MNLRQHAALTRQLIEVVGGVKIADSISRLGKSSFYKAEDAADSYCLPADVILVLEDYAGVTLYSSALFEASKASAPCGASVDVLSEMLLLSERAAHLTADYHRANADGKITPREAAALTTALTAIRAQLSVLDAAIETVPALEVVT